MPVRTSESQGGDAVDQRDFYRSFFGIHPFITESSRSMIRLIDRLNAEFPITDVWLLTSHTRLTLMNAPTYDAGEGPVTIEDIRGDEHLLLFKIPAPDSSPSSEPTRTRTKAIGLEEAIRSIKTAMRASGGWKDSPEL